MTGLVDPRGTIVYRPPGYDGKTDKLGYSKDWRCDPNWEQGATEYIEPLRAIAPIPFGQPADMTLEQWTSGAAAKWVQSGVSGNPPARWLEYYDGAAHSLSELFTAVGTLHAGSWADFLPPRLALHTVRYAPPANQGITPQTNLQVRAKRWTGTAWEYGWLVVCLPLFGAEAGDTQFSQALLAHIDDAEIPEGGGWDVRAQGRIIGCGPRTASLVQGVARESWFFEVDEIWKDGNGRLWAHDGIGRTFQGAHFLIRHTGNAGEWWHIYRRDLTICTAGEAGSGPTAQVNAVGCVQAVNAQFLTYGTVTGHCRPLQGDTWPPTGAEMDFNDTTDWGAVYSEANDWSVNCTVSTSGHRPYVSLGLAGGYSTSSSHVRPMLWYATEDHAPIIVPGSGAAETTDGTKRLRAVRWSFSSKWRGAEGQASFHASDVEIFPDWRENGGVAVGLGWGDDAPAGMEYAPIANGYIKPAGIKRAQNDEGEKTLAVELGDFAATRMRQKAVYDERQAGGQTLGEWANRIAQRMGIATPVDFLVPGLAERIIPYSELPSVPSLAPQDGDDHECQIAAVERACGIRFGFGDALLAPFVDTAPEVYQAGVSEIAWTIDEASLVPEEIVYGIQHGRNGEAFRNFAKVIYGPTEARRTYYWREAADVRAAGIGDDWEAVIVADEGESLEQIFAQFQLHHRRWEDEVEWVGPLRRHILPDQFIRVRVGDIGIEMDAVYQVVDVEHSADFEAFDGETRARMVKVG